VILEALKVLGLYSLVVSRFVGCDKVFVHGADHFIEPPDVLIIGVKRSHITRSGDFDSMSKSTLRNSGTCELAAMAGSLAEATKTVQLQASRSSRLNRFQNHDQQRADRPKKKRAEPPTQAAPAFALGQPCIDQ